MMPKLQLQTLLPINSRRRTFLGGIRRRLRKNKALAITYRQARKLIGKPVTLQAQLPLYKHWIEECEPKLWVAAETWEREPLISIITPAYNTPDKYLFPLIESVKAQVYTNWQLCIADGSTDPDRAAQIETICKEDDRIVYKRLKKNDGIVGNANAALKLAKGDFIAFLDHDDMLSPYALSEVVHAYNKQPETDVFFSDEDKLSDDGKHRSQPFFKPGWSPTLEESVNYMTHLFVVNKDVVTAVGPLKKGFDGAQDYEFILRVTDYTKNIVHIPKILYHWRIADGSTSGPIDNKLYADKAGRQALSEHAKRQKINAEVLGIPELPTNYRLKYRVPNGAKASIIIPFKDKPELLKACVGSILAKTTYDNYEIILVSNNSNETATHDYLETLNSNPKIKVYHWDHTFNFSALNNYGRSQASGDYLVLLNNDTEVINGEWLEELLGVASQPEVGAVGPLLFYPTNKIQHAGIILGMNTMAGHVFRHQREDAITMFGRPYWPRNYLAVTAACLAVKTTKYDEVGGLDETFIMAGNDVAFNLSLYEKGYLNVYWPFAKLYHYENVSVGSYSKAPPSDYDHSLTYYKPYLNYKDPYFNPNLDIMSEKVGIRRKYE